MSFQDNLNDKMKKKLEEHIPTDFTKIFFGNNETKLHLKNATPEDVTAYRKAAKIIKTKSPQSNISIMLDLNDESDTIVVSGYTDESLLMLGVIVGTLLSGDE
jgi:hypothetical protein